MASALSFVKRKVAPRRALAGLFLAAVLGLGGLAAPAARAQSFDLSPYARVLEQYVTPQGQVRYAALKQNPADLDAFLAQLGASSPANHPELFPTPAAQKAYWINAYNAFVLKGVIEAYPLESVVSVRTMFGALFFKRARFLAGGKYYSLDDIEHGILRRQFSDPRIHFALNCASSSCPRLRREPYRTETVEEQLAEAAREFITREENVWMRGDVLFLSKIFEWYREDFVRGLGGDARATVVDYVVRYLPAETARRVRQEKPRVEFYDYDWTLNDAGARAD